MSDYLRKLVSKQPCVGEAHIWASLAEGTFGVYEREYQGETCSDIDVIILVDERHPVPGDWEHVDFEFPWFDLYELGRFDYKGNSHRIDGMLVFPSRHRVELMRRALHGRSMRIC